MKQQAILLTGGTGFIGKRLARTLKDSYVISTFDRSKGLTITNPAHIATAAQGQSVILHFAAAAVGRKKMREYPEAKDIDIVGVKNIVASALQNQSFLIFPSSTLVYGNSTQPLLTEKSELFPTEEYGTSKMLAENFILSSAKNTSLKYSILRLGTIYGPGMPKDSLVAIFLSRAMRGESLSIFGPGIEKRNFLYIDDVCSAIESIIEKQSIAENNIYNICHTDSVSLNDLARLVVEVSHSSSKIIYTPDPQPPDQTISNKKIREQIQWKPKVSLHNGLVKTLEWLKGEEENKGNS